MEFDFTMTVLIESSDLRDMYLRVKRGENFEEVFEDIIAEYDDSIYYNRYCFIEQVKEEINRRLAQSKKLEG